MTILTAPPETATPLEMLRWEYAIAQYFNDFHRMRATLRKIAALQGGKVWCAE